MMKLHEYPEIGEKLYSTVLPNGLEIRVIPKKDFSTCYAAFMTNYGGAHRHFTVDGRTVDTPAGVAHYLEHKMFDLPNGDNALSILSANGADPNAFTSSGVTCYYFQCTEGFEENLRMLLHFVSTPYFTDETVAKEQGIIAQEIRMGEDNPGMVVYYNLLGLLYDHHPIRDRVAGTVESISHITAQTLYECHRVFYAPSNMVLCVEGCVDPETVARIAEEELPKERAEIPTADFGEKESMLPRKRLCRVQGEVSAPQFLAGFKCAPATEGDDYMRAAILGDMASDILLGESSALYQRLYEQGLINPSFGGAFEMMPGVAYLYAGGDSKDANAVTDAILREAARIAAEGVDEDYFRRIRKASFGANLRGLNSFENIAVTLTEGYFHGYDPLRFPEVFESITPEDVAAFLKTNVTAERMVLSRIVPKQ